MTADRLFSAINIILLLCSLLLILRFANANLPEVPQEWYQEIAEIEE